jgi:hypothetical protein
MPRFPTSSLRPNGSNGLGNNSPGLYILLENKLSNGPTTNGFAAGLTILGIMLGSATGFLPVEEINPISSIGLSAPLTTETKTNHINNLAFILSVVSK